MTRSALIFCCAELRILLKLPVFSVFRYDFLSRRPLFGCLVIFYMFIVILEKIVLTGNNVGMFGWYMM